MPPDATLKLLEDVRDAASFILEQAHGHDLHHYVATRLLRDAIERNFIIIGEALAQLRNIDPHTTDRITQCPRIIAFRNRMVHGYDTINHTISWMIIQKELPALLDEVQAILPATPPGLSGVENR